MKKEVKLTTVKELFKKAKRGILSNNGYFLPNEELNGKFLPAFFAIHQRAGGEFVWCGYKFSYLPEIGGWEIKEVK